MTTVDEPSENPPEPSPTELTGEVAPPTTTWTFPSFEPAGSEPELPAGERVVPGSAPLLPVTLSSGARAPEASPGDGPFDGYPIEGSRLAAGGGGLPSGRPCSSGSLFASIAVAALLAGGLGAGLGAAFGTGPAPGASAPASPSGGATSVERIAESVTPAVVDVETTVATPEGAGSDQAAGTGMIIGSSGIVLTNNHVIEQSTSVSVTLAGSAGTYRAIVLGYDAANDVAVLKVEGVSGLATVSPGDSSKVQVGDGVVAIGNALGQGGSPTVVTGAVTALGRNIKASDDIGLAPNSETLHGLIQTDAPIEPGDSGGPLVNSRGQVIGMDTAAAQADAGGTLGFAIPINRAWSIAAQIEQGRSGGGVTIGEPAFLGVYGSKTGSAKIGIIEDGPAAQAGIVDNDVISSIGGKATKTFVALENAIKPYKPGDHVLVTYLDAAGATHSVTVTLSGLPG